MCLLCLTSISAPALAEPPREQIKALNEAQQLMRNEQYQQAAQKLKSVIEENPAIGDAHRLLGHAYRALDRPSKARAAYVEAMGRGRITPALLGRLIRLDLNAGRTHAVLAGLWFRSLLLPDSPDWQRLQMRMLVRHGWPERAQALGRELTDKHPTDTVTLRLLGNSYLKTQDYQRAIESLATAYQLGAQNAQVARSVGDICRQLDRPHAAVRWYDRAIGLMEPSKQRDELVLRRAAVLLATGQVDRPLTSLKQLARRDERALAGRAAFRLGQFAQQRGETETALQHWQRAVALGVERPALFEALGGYQFNQSQYERAAELLTRRIELGDPTRNVYRQLVLSLVRSNQSNRASERLREYIAHFGLDETARALITAKRNNAN